MKEQSHFNSIKRRIEANLTKQGEPVSADIVTREAVEEILAGFLWADDPLREALEYWENMPPGSVFYTVRGYEVNEATVRDAVQAAKRLRKRGIVVAPSEPMFYAMAPASAGVIHGEVAREFWGLIRTKYHLDWPGIVRQAWNKVTGGASKKIKAMAKGDHHTIQSKCLTEAWKTLRRELQAKGKTVADVQREAWERVLGVRPGTPVRPVKPKSEPSAVKQSTRPAKPKKEGKKEGRKKVEIHVVEPTEKTFETPYGPVQVLWTISPHEARDLGRMIDMIATAVKNEVFRALFASGYESGPSLPKGTIPVRVNNRVFAFSRPLLDLCAKQGVPLRIGIMEKGEGDEKAPFLAVAVPRGHYLMPYIGKKGDVSSEEFEFGYPLGAMISAIRGHPEEISLWAQRVLHTTWPPTGKKVAMRSFSIIAPADNDAHPLGSPERDKCTIKLRQKPSWGNYAIGTRHHFAGVYLVCKVEKIADNWYTGLWILLMGFNGPDAAYKAEALADFLATHAPEFGQAFAEQVKSFTSRGQVNDWANAGGHSKLPKWNELMEALHGLDRNKVVGAAAFRMDLEKRWARVTGATASPTIPARQWVVLSMASDGKEGAITALGELVFGKGWKFGKDPKMDRQVEELYIMLRKEGKLKAKGRHYLISPDAYSNLGPSSELAYFRSRGMSRRRQTTHRYFVYSYYAGPGKRLKLGAKRLDGNERDVRDTLPPGLVDLVTVSAANAGEALEKGKPFLKTSLPAKTALHDQAVFETDSDLGEKWDQMTEAERAKLASECGWRTNTGQLTKLGAKISRTPWRELSPAARNVLLRHYGGMAKGNGGEKKQLYDYWVYIWHSHGKAVMIDAERAPIEPERREEVVRLLLLLPVLDIFEVKASTKREAIQKGKRHISEKLREGAEWRDAVILNELTIDIEKGAHPNRYTFYLLEDPNNKRWKVAFKLGGEYYGSNYTTKKEALEAWEAIPEKFARETGTKRRTAAWRHI